MIYDILVCSLNRHHNSVSRWVRGIEANSLTEAAQIACAKYPNLGIVPTVMSMGWHVWPQPEGLS